MRSSESEQAQYERAHQSWELVILDSPGPAVRDALRRIVRLKRFELEKAEAVLPGVIRRGARLDLAPLEAALEEAGIRCQLRRSGSGT
jgi:hypothetical protein